MEKRGAEVNQLPEIVFFQTSKLLPFRFLVATFRWTTTIFCTFQAKTCIHCPSHRCITILGQLYMECDRYRFYKQVRSVGYLTALGECSPSTRRFRIAWNCWVDHQFARMMCHHHGWFTSVQLGSDIFRPKISSLISIAVLLVFYLSIGGTVLGVPNIPLLAFPHLIF